VDRTRAGPVSFQFRRHWLRPPPHQHHGTLGSHPRRRLQVDRGFRNWKKELYNLKQDIGETKDFSEEKPELVEKLSKMLEDWRTSSGSQMATPNPDYIPDKDWRKARQSLTERGIVDGGCERD